MLEKGGQANDEQGMVSLFASKPHKQPRETARSLPPDIRQVDCGSARGTAHDVFARNRRGLRGSF